MNFFINKLQACADVYVHVYTELLLCTRIQYQHVIDVSPFILWIKWILYSLLISCASSESNICYISYSTFSYFISIVSVCVCSNQLLCACFRLVVAITRFLCMKKIITCLKKKERQRRPK